MEETPKTETLGNPPESMYNDFDPHWTHWSYYHSFQSQLTKRVWKPTFSSKNWGLYPAKYVEKIVGAALQGLPDVVDCCFCKADSQENQPTFKEPRVPLICSRRLFLKIGRKHIVPYFSFFSFSLSFSLSFASSPKFQAGGVNFKF